MLVLAPICMAQITYIYIKWFQLFSFFNVNKMWTLYWEFFCEQEDGENITANSLHPGAIATNLFRHHSFVEGIARLFMSVGQISKVYALCQSVLSSIHEGINLSWYKFLCRMERSYTVLCKFPQIHTLI